MNDETDKADIVEILVNKGEKTYGAVYKGVPAAMSGRTGFLIWDYMMKVAISLHCSLAFLMRRWISGLRRIKLSMGREGYVEECIKQSSKIVHFQPQTIPLFSLFLSDDCFSLL